MSAIVKTPKADSYLVTVTVALRLAGLWPWFVTTRPVLKLFNYVYLCFVFANCILINVLSACNFFVIWDDGILAIALNMMNFIIYFTNFFLLVYFRLNMRSSQKLVDFVNQNFKFQSAKGLTNFTMARSIKLAKYATIAIILSDFIGGQYWVVMSLLSEGPNGSRLLPPNIWYPKYVTASPYYEMVYLSYFLGQVQLSVSLGSFEGFYMSCCILVCGQLDVVCCSLRNIRFTAMLKNGVSHCQLGNFAEELIADERGTYFCGKMDNDMDGEVNSVVSTSGITHFTKKTREDLFNHIYDAATKEALKECLRLHQMIMAYIPKFEEFVSPIIFVKIAQITIFMCVNLYSLSFGLTIEVVLYWCLGIGDLLILCFFGNQVTLECAKVVNAAFGSPWWCCDKTVTSSLRILMLSCARPKILQAMKFYGVALYTFVTVLKASFSYYTLLTNIE